MMQYIVTTLAGHPSRLGATDGPGNVASFHTPCGICVSENGFVFVADHNNHKIRKISPDGTVSTFAGAGRSGFTDSDNPLEALFSQPAGICIDDHNNLYVGDFSNHRVRKISSNGKVTTIGSNLTYSSPLGTCVDGGGNVFVSDRNNGRVVKIPLHGIAVKICSVYEPYGICVSKMGNVYVANNEGVYKLSKVKDDENETTYAKTLHASGFEFLLGISVDEDENVYACDSTSNKIKKILIDGRVKTLAGSTAGYRDGSANIAQFKQPWGVAVDRAGCVYVSGWHNQCIRKIMPSDKLAIDWPSSHLELSKSCRDGIVELLMITYQKELPKDLIVLNIQKLILVWLFHLARDSENTHKQKITESEEENVSLF